MDKGVLARAETLIRVSPAEVWKALTDPDLIKDYLFGTQVESTWQVGGAIVYRGEWQGKSYEDKGKILELVPEQRFVSTYWSSLSGVPDVPENYQTVRYELEPEGDQTRVTVIQDNNATQEAADHSSENWAIVLQTMKQLLET